MKNDIKSITEFLNFYNGESTGKNYQSAISNYLKEIYPDAESTVNNSKTAQKKTSKSKPKLSKSRLLDILNAMSIQYLKEIRKGRDFKTDLTMVNNIFIRKYAPNTSKKYIQIVIIWLEFNEINITFWDKKRIFAKSPTARPISEEMDMEKEIWRDICDNLPQKYKAVVLCLLGSGMRTGECLKLKKSDVDFTSTPVKGYLKQSYKKGKIPRMCMLSKEAVTELRAYLETRTDVDERLFPFPAWTLSYIWRRTIDGLGYGEKDPNTGIRMLHLHMTRKWFLSQFPLAASQNIGEMLAGHMGYLSGSYRRYSHKIIAREFLKAESSISIYENEPVYTSITATQAKA